MDKLFKRLIPLFILMFSLLTTVQAAKVVSLTVNGGIGPATADYLSRGIEQGQNASLILIKIDTPGGLDKSTRQIVQEILKSKIPVVVYVSPNGARAASAGTFLLYASTIAAMAPSTHLGAASPVNLAAGMGGDDKEQASTRDKKVENDAIAYIRSLAQLRGRDLSFAEKAVSDAATLTATEALKQGVINFIAKDDKELLSQLNGLMVVQDGQKI